MPNESSIGGEPRKNGVTDTVAGASATVHDTVQKLGAQAVDAGERVYRAAADAGTSAVRQVEEQPWFAVIATGLLGVALGFLLGRSSVPAPRTARDYVNDYLPRNLRRR